MLCECRKFILNLESIFGRPEKEREGGGERKSNYDNQGREKNCNIFIDALYIGFKIDCYICLKMAIFSCLFFLLSFMKSVRRLTYAFIGGHVSYSICEESL